MDAGVPPPPYERAREEDARDAADEGPPLKAQKQSADAYPGKGAYDTIDFLGNVSGGPHAAAAEALATFSSTVGESANNSNLFVNVPPPAPAQVPTQSSHTQSGPPFLCPTCNTSYSRLEYLRRHERRHADIRPFSCPCGKAFSRSDVLARHKTKCRVVLSGEGQASAASGDARAKDRTTRGAQRSTRTRGPGTPRREREDVTVDPALHSPVDPSMQPPPPLEGGAQGEEEYAGYPPPTYAHHGAYENEYTQAPPPPPSSKNAHYATGSQHPVQMRMHDKMYAHNAPPRSGSASYVSSAPAIHPELSTRNAAAYSGSPNGSSSPGTSGAYYTHGEHGYPGHVHYAEVNVPSNSAPGAPPAGTASGASMPASYSHGKERYGVAGSSLSPFSNTALSSNASPYLSAFSCARDMPHMSPRLGPSNNPPSTKGEDAQEPQ